MTDERLSEIRKHLGYCVEIGRSFADIDISEMYALLDYVEELREAVRLYAVGWERMYY